MKHAQARLHHSSALISCETLAPGRIGISMFARYSYACGEQGGAASCQPTTWESALLRYPPEVFMKEIGPRTPIHCASTSTPLRTPCSWARSVAVSRKFDEPRSPRSTYFSSGRRCSSWCEGSQKSVVFLASLTMFGDHHFDQYPAYPVGCDGTF